MATKQGLTAQLSQASEDAKRAVLQRSTAVIKSSSQWFSNMNTTCTIKSAPHRTPDVLQLLAVKSGFLYKRNEQHVWQARWCCVVPHMFLYYFDAAVAIPPSSTKQYYHPTTSINATTTTATHHPSSYGPAIPPPTPPTLSQQDLWNNAVRYGYDGIRGKQGPRSSLYHVFPSNNNNNREANTSSSSSNTILPSEGSNQNAALEWGSHSATTFFEDATTNTITTTTAASSNSSSSLPTPTGIIDLECYTSVHRSTQNSLVLELAGDDTVNPDLRGFYFVARDELDAEDWTQALLGQRHSQLVDERDAYKQVCDGFAAQLQELHAQLDNCHVDLEHAKEEVYSVRCHMEEQRRSCWKHVEEALDQLPSPQDTTESHPARTSSATTTISNGKNMNLEEIRSQDGSALAALQLLLDYTKSLEETCAQLQLSNEELEREKEGYQHTHSEQDHFNQKQMELEAQVKDWQHQFQCLQDTYQAERMVWQQDTAAQKATLQQFKTKLKEMQGHKKILKREVIELRKKFEEMESEMNLLQHRHGKQIDYEHSKQEMLERYVAKIESQVQVQQNMMEMMSSSISLAGGGGGGSFYAGCGEGGGGTMMMSTNMSLRSNNGGGGGSGSPAELPRSIVAPRYFPPPIPPPPTLLMGSSSSRLPESLVTDVSTILLDPDETDDHDGNTGGCGNDDDNNNGHDNPQPPHNSSSSGHHHHHHHHNYNQLSTNHVSSVLTNSPSTTIRASVVSSQQQQPSLCVVSGSLSHLEQPKAVVDDSYQDSAHHDLKRSGYSAAANGNSPSLLPDDSDTKSHMSELTEDRTQKQFDIVYHHHQQQQQDLLIGGRGGGSYHHNQTRPSHGITAASPNRAVTTSNQKYSSPTNTGGPPSYILSATEKEGLLSSFVHSQPRHPRLDTINAQAGGPTSLAATTPTRLSVAQRARMEADRAPSTTNPMGYAGAPGGGKAGVRSSSSNSSPKKMQVRGNTTNSSSAASVSSNTTGATSNPHRGDRSVTTAGSFLSNLGKRLEHALDNSILGVPDISAEFSFDDDDDDDEDEENNQNNHPSSRHHRVPREEKKTPDAPKVDGTDLKRLQQQKQAFPSAVRTNDSTSTSVVLPKAAIATATLVASSSSKSNSSLATAVSPHMSNLSLQERQKIQRAKQLAFLKQQGIIQKDDEVRGGAGGGGNSSASTSPSTWMDSNKSSSSSTVISNQSTNVAARPRPTAPPQRANSR